MSKQKKLFVLISVLFVLVMIGFTVHFFSITTLPGKKGQLQQRIETRLEGDSTKTDSVPIAR